ncbi:U11/U12 small nuclear ribonucleoprotein 48 kDa protein-like [Prorops nasuta]|uniref:U11/U12 small nuclear ribonucleoprotein 48 kDa protein-like n=1 Tax=Prorops nasuta TaxID=863751 RepID=UPI0034CFC153
MISDRHKDLDELEAFSNIIDGEIKEITAKLNWTVESLTKNSESVIICPYNPAHKINEKCLDKHLATCQWKAEGYGPNDLPLPESSLPPNSTSNIIFDEQLQDCVIKAAKEKDSNMKLGMGQRLIPRTSNRLLTDFTSDERKALYEYVIANTVAPDIGSDITDLNKPKSETKADKETAYLELLAQERNLKRRRAKHKGVHTNKKSQTEILREIIHQQMEMYAEYLEEQGGLQLSGVPKNTPYLDKRDKTGNLPDLYQRSDNDNSMLMEHNGQNSYTDEYYPDRYKPYEEKHERRKRSYEEDYCESQRHNKRHKSDLREDSKYHKRKSSDKYREHHSSEKYRHKEDRHKSKKHKSKDRHRSLSTSGSSRHKKKDRKSDKER